MICKLLKVLYNLKQASHFWYERLSEFLFPKLDLVRINADHSIFISVVILDGHVVSTFVDKIKIMAPKERGHIA